MSASGVNGVSIIDVPPSSDDHPTILNPAGAIALLDGNVLMLCPTSITCGPIFPSMLPLTLYVIVIVEGGTGSDIFLNIDRFFCVALYTANLGVDLLY